ncbi:hypothetical protein D1007_53582 [Hordeum vulgare]|nr:hypothetical protein D1007_53582 [Hordeum vulgare]
MSSSIYVTAADLAEKERRLPTRSKSEEKTAAAAATPQGLCPVTARATTTEGRGGGGGFELDEPTDLVIAPMRDIEMAKLFGIPVYDRYKEAGESSLVANADGDVDGDLVEEATDDVDDALDDELVHVYDKENPVIAVGKLLPSMDEFRMCFKTYAVKHEFDAKTVWTDRKKFDVRCRGFYGSVHPFKWRNRASQTLVFEECWSTKKARVNRCRKNRIVPEPDRVDVQTEENLVVVNIQSEETVVEVDTKPERVEVQTKETHVEVHREETETRVNIQTKETALEGETEPEHVEVPTKETALKGETEKIESLVCFVQVLKPLKKSKMITEVVCIVEPKIRSAKAKKGT